MTSFSEIGLHESILKAVADLGFETPTPIQAKAIPVILETAQDILAFAQTGTGKTAAFGLPTVQHADEDVKHPQTLILCPTRELCLQISKDLTAFAKYRKGLSVVAVYGGANIETQIRALRKGAQIVVGTPGRTKDLIKRKKLLLNEVERVILDEADEMLTMGFKDDLDMIINETPTDRQTLLFSATMSKQVMSVAKKFLDNPVELKVARMNEGAKNVAHIYYMVHAKNRYEVVKRIADMNPDIYGIVFCRTRRETKEVANRLMNDGYNADLINGDLSQAQRDTVMERFRSRQLQILVATDVAARGLDVDDLTHVINYTLPDDPEVYIHRSGRTGRAGKSGISICIIHTREKRKLREIERKGGFEFTRQSVPTGRDICRVQLLAMIDKVTEVKVNDEQIEPFMGEIYEKLAGIEREALIKRFVSTEFNRFLSYYRRTSDINVPEKGERTSSAPQRNTVREKKSIAERRKKDFSRLYINVGTKHNLTPLRLIGLVNEALDSSAAEIGKIEIMKKFAFFEVEKKYADELMKALNSISFERVPLTVEFSTEKPAGAFVKKEKKAKRKQPFSEGKRKSHFKSKNRKNNFKKRR